MGEDGEGQKAGDKGVSRLILRALTMTEINAAPKTLQDLERLLVYDLKVKVAGERERARPPSTYLFTRAPRCRWYADTPFRSLPVLLYWVGTLLVDGVLRGKYMVSKYRRRMCVA